MPIDPIRTYIDTIEFNNGSKLILSDAPSTMRIAQYVYIPRWKRQGVNTIMILLTPSELYFHRLGNLLLLYKAEGFSIIACPIEDFRLPTDLPRFDGSIDKVITKLEAHNNVLIHCYAGIGRTGIASTCVMVKLGLTALESYKFVSKARPIIDTVDQYKFISQYESYLRGQK